MMDDTIVYRHDEDSGSELDYDSEDSWLSFNRDALDNVSSSDDEQSAGTSSASFPKTNEKNQSKQTKRKRGRVPSDNNNIGPGGDSNVNDNIEWESYDFLDPYTSNWIGRFPISGVQTGVLVDDYSNKEPIDFFKLFFPNSVIDLLLVETNRYAHEILDGLDDTNIKKKSWKDVTENEMNAFIGLQIAMGLQDMKNVKHHWSTFWLTATSFGKIFSRNRFQQIQSFLHFENNNKEVPRDHPNYDPLWKIKPLLNLTQNLYVENFYPSQHLSIDESMIKFKGRHMMKQYLPDKPTKWGFKVFSLVDSKTKYCLRNMYYCGKKYFKNSEGKNVGETVVAELLDGFTHKNHILYCDSAYTSPKLFLELQTKNTGAVGTIVENRRDFPEFLKKKNLKLVHHGEPVFARANNLVAFAWHDSKRMYMLSTVHNNITIDKSVRDKKAVGGRREVEKPVIAENYNTYMGGVDHFDQRMGSYCYPHRNRKWYTAIYHYVKEIALINGYILYTECMSQNKSPAISSIKFRQCIIESLVKPQFEVRSQKKSNNTSKVPNVSRLNAAAMNHFPRKFEDPKHRPRCVVCSSIGVRRQTQLHCQGCEEKPPLCIDCFHIYHTKEDFKAARNAVDK